MKGNKLDHAVAVTTTPNSAVPIATPAPEMHADPVAAFQRMAALPITRRLNHVHMLALQRTVGNQAVNQLLARRTNQAQPSTVIQKAGPEYHEHSPEKEQHNSLTESWKAIEATDLKDKEKFSEKVGFLESQLPGISVGHIKSVLTDFQDQEIEVILKNILQRCSEEELKNLERVRIDGRYGKWQLINQRLGRGGEANVYKGLRLSDEAPVAIKIFNEHNDQSEDAFRKEINSYQLLKKIEQEGNPIPHVVRMLDYNTYIKSVVMEQVRGYSMDTIRQKLLTVEKLQQTDVDDIIREMTQKYNESAKETDAALHKHGYRLGDVQSRNIMYDYVKKKITFIDISLEQV